MGLSICPKIEGVEPLSKLPVLLEEAGRLSQSVAVGNGFLERSHGRFQGWEHGWKGPSLLLLLLPPLRAEGIHVPRELRDVSGSKGFLALGYAAQGQEELQG